jgi:hypothetical protein
MQDIKNKDLRESIEREGITLWKDMKIGLMIFLKH